MLLSRSTSEQRLRISAHSFSLLLLAFIHFTLLWRDEIAASYVTATILIAANIYYCRDAPKQKIVFLIFNLTAFLFLLGRAPVAYFFPDIDAAYPKPALSIATEKETISLCFISLLVIRIAFSIMYRPTAPIKSEFSYSIYLTLVRKIAICLAYIALIPYVVVLAERAMFVSVSGYEAYYTIFRSSVPVLFSRMGSLYEPLLFLYLATFPSQKAAKTHLLLFVFLGLLSLGFGQRTGFVLNVVLSVVYLSLRDVVTPEKRPWLSKPLIYGGLTGVIPLLVFMTYFTYYRSGTTAYFSSLIDTLGTFFVSQGSAIYNLSYTIQYSSAFPEGRFYSLGPAISFIKESQIFTMLFGGANFAPASAGLALETSKFSYALAYIVDPNYYARGGGFGSNYIAELWVDFGVAGVVVGSALYGLLMAAFIPFVRRRNPFVIALALAAVINLLYSPRAEFLGFVIPLLSVVTIVAYIGIHVVARSSAQSRNGFSSQLSRSPFRRHIS